MSKQPLPIGVDDFKEVIEQNYYFVDKSLFIKDLLDKQGKVNLFTRPRRFGKSLNLSMLRAFFEDVKVFQKDNTALFQGLKILEAGERYTSELGRYPVISLSLKSAKQPTFEIAYYVLTNRIREEYRYHDYLLKGNFLTTVERDIYSRIAEQDLDYKLICESLQFLSQCLYKYHGQKVIILIDEYDVPLENAYFEEQHGEQGFYRQMTGFIRSLFESALKTNEALHFAVITGCLRITKESIFTGLNNLKINSILTDHYGEYFGFTQVELDSLLKTYGLEAKQALVKQWYDGYRFGQTEVYNPWSVLNLIDNGNAIPKPYWANTSSNVIVRHLVERADRTVKQEIEALIAGQTIEKAIHEEITYEDIYRTQDNLWNFLFFTGYLKQIATKLVNEDTTVAQLALPNVEVRYIYKNTILNWFEQQLKQKDLSTFHNALITGKTERITQELNQYLAETISFYDQKEAFYQGFMLGLLQSFPNGLISSNRESGEGRYDIVLKIPSVNTYDQAIILELKVAKSLAQLEIMSQKALEQIQTRAYAQNLYAEGYEVIASYGIAFFRKKCWVTKR